MAQCAHWYNLRCQTGNLWDWTKEQIGDAGGIQVGVGFPDAGSYESTGHVNESSGNISDEIEGWLDKADDYLGRIRAATQPYGGSREMNFILLILAAVIIWLVARRG